MSLKQIKEEVLRRSELKYIEDFFDTRVKEIEIKKTTKSQWEKDLKPMIENCSLDHTNESDDIANYLEIKVKEKNDYENIMEARTKYKDKRVVEYGSILEDLDAGIDRSKKNRARDKAEQKSQNRVMDSEFPVPFYLKDEYRGLIIGLIVLAEAILFYSTSALIFNNNPEVNVMITLSLSGASILLIMLLAYEQSKDSLDKFEGFTGQQKLSLCGIVLVLSCYVWFRIATKHVIDFASDASAVEWAGTIMIALTPLFISLVAYKIEYYAEVNENLKKRHAHQNKTLMDKCKRIKAAYPTLEEFEQMEEDHMNVIKRNVEIAITDEVRFGMACFDYLHVQQINAQPDHFKRIMKALGNNYKYVMKEDAENEQMKK